MTDRRLPPALEAVRGEHGFASECWSRSDLLDWLYGTETVCPSCGRKWEGNCKDPDCVGGRLGTPGLVERVLRRADNLYLSESDVAGPVMSSADYWIDALRAELGEDA